MRFLRYFRRDTPRLHHTAVSFTCTAILLFFIGCGSKSKTESRTSSTPAATQSTATPVAFAPKAAQPLNIVLITIDTLRADHLHCYGDRKISTPVLDGLAKQGVLFEHAVTQAPLTQPSHASIFTGTNPNVHGVRDTGGFVLKAPAVTMATLMRRRGWNTAGFIGSEVLRRTFGFNQGFTYYDDEMPRSNKAAGYARAASRPANIIVDHAIHWLDDNSGKQPIFLWMHFYDPHEPYHPPAAFQRQYPHDLYSAEIAFTDQQIGRFLEVLRKKFPADKTLIVVMSDHGEGLGEHGEYNHGIFLYDSTLRIPWIMAGPGIPPGVRVQQQAREIDLLPTILDLTGGKAAPVVQGTSLVPTFFGKPVDTAYSYEETLYPKINLGWAELRGIHTAHWMYIRAPKSELYDLDTDPGELHNVIDSNPKEYRELDRQLQLLSSGDAKTITAGQMDDRTTEQLKSLGYVGGTAKSAIQLNGQGPDPKDRVAVLKIIYQTMGPDAEKLPAARKIELLKKGLAEDASDPALYLQLGELYTQTAQWDAAVATYQAAIRAGAQNEMILSRLADIYLRAGEPNNAIRYLSEAVALNPLNAQSESNLGTAYLDSNHFPEAEKAFRLALVAGEYAPAYNGLAILAQRRNDEAGARKNFERAIQLDPDYAEPQFNLGSLCKQTGDMACERRAFQSFLRNAPAGSYQKQITQVKTALAAMGTEGER